jgi:hypothetical protein
VWRDSVWEARRADRVESALSDSIFYKACSPTAVAQCRHDLHPFHSCHVPRGHPNQYCYLTLTTSDILAITNGRSAQTSPIDSPGDTAMFPCLLDVSMLVNSVVDPQETEALRDDSALGPYHCTWRRYNSSSLSGMHTCIHGFAYGS